MKIVLFALAMILFSGCISKGYQPKDVVIKFEQDVDKKAKNIAKSDSLNKQLRIDINRKYEDIKDIYSFNEASSIQNNSFALIIGIDKYKENTNVEFADLSAMAFRDLLNVTFGLPKENIITLLNHDATSGQIKSKIELLKELASSNSNIYVYFAGHGIPAKNNQTYILPQDMSADSIELEPNLMLKNIYDKLTKSEAKNIFVVIDSCFSGKDDNGDLLYKGVAPVMLVDEQNIKSDKITIFTAGGSNDFANEYKDVNQRLFSYYLIEELSKGKKNISEIYKTIKDKVKKRSLLKGIGYKQIPQLDGNKYKEFY
jgi:hypothetical protein